MLTRRAAGLRYSRTMEGWSPIDSADRKLVQIVDRATAEAVSKSGSRVVCGPGCMECCMGPFPISPLDARRLQRGLAELEREDPAKAARIRERAGKAAARGTQADDEPCPVLDTGTGTCDLYEFRPLTCRVFGPPVRCGEGPVGVCELCFEGAPEEEIAACAVDIDTDALEQDLLREIGDSGSTLAALALAPPSGGRP
jgi:Fe-S-cluster containining protein